MVLSTGRRFADLGQVLGRALGADAKEGCMAARRKLTLASLTLILVVTLLTGSALQPVTVRSEVTPQTYCRWVWDSTLMMWCYYCCDVYGCWYEACDYGG